MDQRFVDCLTSFTWRPENDGQGGHLDHNDPGGLTSWGMTYQTYCGWLRQKRQPIVSQQQFVALPRTAFYLTFQDVAWNEVSAGSLPIGLDLMAFDFAIVANYPAPIAVMQSLLGISADGVLGPQTEAALVQNASKIDLDAFLEKQIAYYKTRSGYARYGGGWTRRANDAHAQALIDRANATPMS